MSISMVPPAGTMSISLTTSPWRLRWRAMEKWRLTSVRRRSMFCLKEHYKGVIPQCWIDKLNSNSNLKRERSGSPPDRRRWCREPPAAVCGAGTAAAAARAPVDGLKTVRKGAPLCNHFLNHPSFTAFHVQCPQQHTLILYILLSSNEDLGNTLSYFKGTCPNTFAAYCIYLCVNATFELQVIYKIASSGPKSDRGTPNVNLF